MQLGRSLCFSPSLPALVVCHEQLSVEFVSLFGAGCQNPMDIHVRRGEAATSVARVKANMLLINKDSPDPWLLIASGEWYLACPGMCW